MPSSQQPDRRPARSRQRRGAGPGRASRAGFVCAALAGLVPLGAAAGDRSLTGSISEQLLADTNVQLDQGDGSSIGSITTLNLAYADRRATSVFSLGTGFSYSAFSGQDNDNISGLFPSVNGAYVVNRPTRSLSFTFGASVEPVDFFENTNIQVPRDDGGDDGDDGDGGDDDGPTETTTRNVNRETLRLRGNVGVGYSHQVNSRDSISLGLSASRLDFLDNDGSLTPSTTFGYNTGWNRIFTDKISAGVGANVRYFEADDDVNRQTVSVDVAPNLSWARTPKERYSFGLGPAYTITRREIPLLGGGTRIEREETVSLRGSAGMSYAGEAGTFSANLTQSAEPTDEGVLANRTSFSLGWSRRVSSTSSVTAGASGSVRTALSGDTSGDFDDSTFARFTAGYSRSVNTFSSANASTFYQVDDEDGTVTEGTVGVNVGYSYLLTEATSANLGYSFRVENQEETSHRVFLTLSRGFTIIP